MWGGMQGLGWGWIGFVLFWGLVILAIVALVKWFAPGAGPSSEQRPIDILKARYAKGELTREQFEQMKRELAD